MDSNGLALETEREVSSSEAKGAEGRRMKTDLNDEDGNTANLSEDGVDQNIDKSEKCQTVESKSSSEGKFDDKVVKVDENKAAEVDENKGEVVEKIESDKDFDAFENDYVEDKANPNSNNVGRRGDPRMHRAMKARLANPELSLLEALRIGGFEFPNGTDGDGKSDRNVYDADNVLLCQRKNQLSRRLRLAKKKTEPESGNISSSDKVESEEAENQQDDATESNSSNPNQQQFSNPNQQPNLKRPHDGTSEQQPSLKSARGHTNVPIYHQPMPPPNLAAFLQQQQAPGYFGGNQYFNIQQQGFGNPFTGQFPLNYGLGIPHQGLNGNLGQSGQTPFDRYLELTASSMGTNSQSMLFPGSNLGRSVASPSIIQRQNESSQTVDKNDDASKKDKENEKGLEPRHLNQLDKAVEIFNLQKAALATRCLVMAGFSEEDLQKSPQILIDFEELIKHKK